MANDKNLKIMSMMSDAAKILSELNCEISGINVYPGEIIDGITYQLVDGRKIGVVVSVNNQSGGYVIVANLLYTSASKTNHEKTFYMKDGDLLPTQDLIDWFNELLGAA